MFWNNVKIAIRNLRKHKGFAAINIIGLAIGLVVFVFGGLLVEYEQTHDVFFENSDRTIFSIISSSLFMNLFPEETVGRISWRM